MKKLSNTEAELKKSAAFFKNPCSSFSLDTDSFSFIFSKKLFHTSFKLNIVHFSRDQLPGPLLIPLRDSQCIQVELHFISQFMQNTESFPLLILNYLQEVPTDKKRKT